MAKKKPVKRVAVAVPSSLEEAAEFVRQMGEHQRALATIQAKLNDEIEKLKAEAVADSLSYQEAIEELFEGIFVFAQSRRDELTEKGKTKTVRLPTGEMIWRMTPPAVSIRGVEEVIAACKRLGLTQFVRTKEEPDKEAMLKEPEVAQQIKGVTISQREEFVVKPSQATVEISRGITKPRKDTGKK